MKSILVTIIILTLIIPLTVSKYYESLPVIYNNELLQAKSFIKLLKSDSNNSLSYNSDLVYSKLYSNGEFLKVKAYGHRLEAFYSTDTFNDVRISFLGAYNLPGKKYKIMFNDFSKLKNNDSIYFSIDNKVYIANISEASKQNKYNKTKWEDRSFFYY